MRIKALIGISLLVLFYAIPSRAQDISHFNFHVGGGFGIPLNPTARYAGLSGTFQVGAGPNLNSHNSLVGEFMWHGLPANRSALLPLVGSLCPPTATPAQTQACTSFGTSVNLYAVTANYMYHTNGTRYGFYVIGGGGWYYRRADLKNYTVAPGTVCEPAWDWWGYTCTNGLVSTSTVLATRGISSGGLNGGGGMTINLGESGLKFYIEARYHYSPQGGRLSTQIVPVTFGFRW
jgi:hypothetical protein